MLGEAAGFIVHESGSDAAVSGRNAQIIARCLRREGENGRLCAGRGKPHNSNAFVITIAGRRASVVFSIRSNINSSFGPKFSSRPEGSSAPGRLCGIKDEAELPGSVGRRIEVTQHHRRPMPAKEIAKSDIWKPAGARQLQRELMFLMIRFSHLEREPFPLIGGPCVCAGVALMHRRLKRPMQ